MGTALSQRCKTFAERAAGWLVAVGGSAALVSFLGDAMLLARGGAQFREFAVGGVVAAALTIVLSLPFCLVGSASVGLLSRSRYSRIIGACAVAIVAAFFAYTVLDPPRRRLQNVYWIFNVFAAFTAGGIVVLTHEKKLLRRAILAVLAVLLLLGDLYVPALAYPELHAVLGGLAWLSWSSFLLPSVPVRSRWLNVGAVGLVVMSVITLLAADSWSPIWRNVSRDHGLFASRSLSALQAVLDWDRDGFSNFFGGGDCDDGDRLRNPLAPDPIGGGDDNCNGVNPREDSWQARGLAPPVGEPGLAKGVPLVVIITVDTLRQDAMVPELMPHLTGLAAQCTTLTMNYAAGASTLLSLPALFRADDAAPSLLAWLPSQGVRVDAIVDSVNFANLLGISPIRVSGASAVSEAAQRVLAQPADRRLLWTHFFDPHTPRPNPSLVVPPVLLHLPEEYRRAVMTTDIAIGQLLEFLRGHSDLQNAVVLFTADHGEAFGEHGVASHGRSGLEAILRVPTFLCAPTLKPGPRAILTSHRDIPATIFGAFGFMAESSAAERFGRSWLRLATSDASLHEIALARSARFASGKETDGPLLVVVDAAGRKVVAEPAVGLVQYFDVTNDPGENVDLFPQRQAEALQLLQRGSLAADLDGYPANFRGPAKL